MKRLLIFALVLSFGFTILYGQPSKDDLNKQIKIELEKEMADMPGGAKVIMKLDKTMSLDEPAADAAYMGIFVQDLDFPKAQELGYKGNAGVLITGVVPDSPAWQYRLQEDDILTAIDGREVSNNATFDKLRKQYRAGDAVKLDIFRSGEILSIDFTFGSRNSEASSGTEAPEAPEKPKLSAGYGGGTYVPMWFMPDLDDVNHLITGMGFPALDDNGILMQGGEGKGNIGKGFFLGGGIYSYENAQKTSDTEDPEYKIWLRYENTMGGVTLDKRVPISRKVITSAGVMLGGAKHTVEFLKSNDEFNWSNWDDTAMDSNNTHNTISRGYLIVQPRAEVMYRLLSWMGVRAQGSYTYGYSTRKGWKIEGLNGEDIVVHNSPDTPYQGFSITVGPWFGF